MHRQETHAGAHSCAGWVWVPDTEWAPAWVSWRTNDHYVGWAPLPPEARFEAKVGFHDWVDSTYDIGPSNYSFVEVRNLGAPRLRAVMVEPRQNITIISETRNITNITYVNNVVMNQGPQYDVIVRQTAQPIRRLKLERRTDIDLRADVRTTRFDTQVSGDSLRVIAPEVEVRRDAAPKKVSQKIDQLQVNRGWKNAGDPQQVQQARAKISGEAKAPAGLQRPKLIGSEQRPAGVEATPPATAAEPRREREMKEPGNEPPAVAAQPPAPGQPVTSPEKPPQPGVAAQPPTREQGQRRSAIAKRPAPAEPPPPVAEGSVGNRRGETPDAPPKRGAKNRPEAREENNPPDRANPVPAPGNERPKADDARPRGPAETMPPRPDNAGRPPAELPPRPEAAERPKPAGPPPGEAARPRPERPDAPDRPAENRPPAANRAKPEAPAGARPDAAAGNARGGQKEKDKDKEKKEKPE